MTSYQVDSEAVFGASGAVRASSDRIQAEVQGMLGQLTNLQSSWAGQAASAFQAVISDWRTTQQRVTESLVTINSALAQAGQQYAETEQANARLFNR
jgi:early secretory antigenic target protein ESAT-6